jgi:hypothetical protein
MENIQVTARFDDQGKVTPLRFVWQGNTYPVDATGRRWQDDKGQHVLVMVPGDRVFELIFIPTNLRWFLISHGLRTA